MIHEDSQPLVSWVNICVNVIQIGKLSHREVVFVKKMPPRCVHLFFLAHSLEKLKTSIFQMCWVCTQIQRSPGKLYYKSSKWGDSRNWPHFCVENLIYGCTAILLPKKVNLLHEQQLMRPPEMIPERTESRSREYVALFSPVSLEALSISLTWKCNI